MNTGYKNIYTDELRARLAKYGITHGELARQIPKAPSELSRWFNTRTTPTMKNIARIEEAILAIRKRRRAEKKRQ